MNRPVAIDLFSGCGGMSLGLEAAGFDVAVSVEFDAVHALVHHCNFPYGRTICKDISKLKSEELLTALRDGGYSEEIDLIAGGPPCQGFSHIGKRQLDDPRNSLVFEYLRIISDLKPKYFIFENVPGIASGQHKKFLNELICEFEKIGYHVDLPFKILDASLYGAPQKRKRLILIGTRDDQKKAFYPTETHEEGDSKVSSLFEISKKNLTTVGMAISDLANHPAFIDSDTGISAKDLDYSGFRENYSLIPNGEFKLCHRRSVRESVFGHIGSKHTEKSIDRFRNTEPGTVEKTSRFLKLASSGLCNTLRAGTASDKGAYTAPRPIHYSEPRCITVREAARLHTFPDWFQFHGTIWHGFREIGNAVIPLLAKKLGDQVIEALGIDNEQLPTYVLDAVDEKYLKYNMGQASAYWDIPDDVIPKRKRLAVSSA